jgi:hypothetical protein
MERLNNNLKFHCKLGLGLGLLNNDFACWKSTVYLFLLQIKFMENFPYLIGKYMMENFHLNPNEDERFCSRILPLEQ